MITELTLFEGIEIDATNPEEPRIPATELARRAGHSQPRDIKKLVEKYKPQLVEFGEVYCRVFKARQSTGNGASREYEANDYMLNEGQSSFILGRLETPTALSFNVQLIKLWLAWKHNRLTPAPTPYADDPGMLQLEFMKQQRIAILANEAATRRIQAEQEAQAVKIEKLTTMVGHDDACSAVAFTKRPSCKVQNSNDCLNKLGKIARNIAAERELPLRQIPHAIYGNVNAWPEDVWVAAQEALTNVHPKYKKKAS